MKKIKLNKEFLVIIGFFIIIILGNSIFLLFFFSENKKEILYKRLTIEKKISLLIEAIRQNNIEEVIPLDKEILSFGFYNGDGIKIFGYNNPPEEIRSNFIKPDNEFFEIRNDVITIIRILLPPMPFSHIPHDMVKRNMIKKMEKIIYLKIKNKSKKFTLFFLLFELFLLTLIILLFYLYRKNASYKKRLEQQNELMKIAEISRTLAHEIKNPLSSIKLQTVYLKKILPENFKGEVSGIEQEIERIRTLTDRIRDLVKDPVGERIIIDLYDFCKNIAKKYNYPIKIKKPNENEKYSIYFDKERLRIIIENLLNNAIESMNEIGSNSEIELLFNSLKDSVELKILDEGTGIKENEISKVFEPFYTNKSNGSGIGLSIVKRYIDANNGKITIANRTDKKGAVVTLKFKKPEFFIK